MFFQGAIAGDLGAQKAGEYVVRGFERPSGDQPNGNHIVVADSCAQASQTQKEVHGRIAVQQTNYTQTPTAKNDW
jgi:hypothetical protein